MDCLTAHHSTMIFCCMNEDNRKRHTKCMVIQFLIYFWEIFSSMDIDNNEMHEILNQMP